MTSDHRGGGPRARRTPAQQGRGPAAARPRPSAARRGGAPGQAPQGKQAAKRTDGQPAPPKTAKAQPGRTGPAARADRTAGRTAKEPRVPRTDRTGRSEPTGRPGRSDRTEPSDRTGRADRPRRAAAGGGAGSGRAGGAGEAPGPGRFRRGAAARPSTTRRPPRSRRGGAVGGRTGGRGPSAVLRRTSERFRRAMDRPLTAYYLILGGGLLIIVLGLVMVFSASQIKALQAGLPSTYFFVKQLVAASIGCGLLLLASRMPVRLHRALAYPLLLCSVFLMLLVQVPGIGHAVNGNQNWIHLGGPFQLQPSEIGKLALVLWSADLIARKHRMNLLTQWKHLLVPLVPVAMLLLGLIMLGGDMGTAMILGAILLGLLWLAGAPARLFGVTLGVAGAVTVVLIKTSANRMGRLACIGATDPGPNDQCWQAVHGIYALASGGWFGSGLGASVEKWGQLPEPHTDFIFAVTGEELGLAGTLSVLALFTALGYAGIRVAGRTEDPFVRFAAGGVTTWITAQAVINIGAVLGLLPIAGVPLPLFSYGGSALLPTMFAIGMLLSFARSEPAARAALATRAPGVVTRTMGRLAWRRSPGER